MSDEELDIINDNAHWFSMMQQMMVVKVRKLKINNIKEFENTNH